MPKTIARPKTIALISHDGLKTTMAEFVGEWADQLSRYPLVATRGTGRVLRTTAGLQAEVMRSGPYGGDVEIANRVYTGDIGLVIFFRDPLSAHPHEADVQALLRACDLQSVPIATNRGSADILMEGLRACAQPRLAIAPALVA